MANLPSWVAQSNTSAVQQPMLGASAPMQSAQATAPLTPAQQQKNPNSWDGIGPNTNQNAPQVSNMGNPVDASNVGSLNLPPQMQQILQMFQQMGGQGFNGLQPVQGNPFAPNGNGANLSQWGANSTSGGIYGGT